MRKWRCSCSVSLVVNFRDKYGVIQVLFIVMYIRYSQFESQIIFSQSYYFVRNIYTELSSSVGKIIEHMNKLCSISPTNSLESILRTLPIQSLSIVLFFLYPYNSLFFT